ncbi:MAG TPA: glucosidase, partial [Candidatus Eisenbacteria bacterium]|nr:glucosidase [Candidatus Eisenbacteria bacterium]
DGNAWRYFPHDQARSRAYRWGEDGLGGISDDHQRLCFAVALWNGKDPILKERLYGLDNGEGNHGEDVKEYYFYLDSTPTHSYMRYLYKYPHAPFPYAPLWQESARRSRHEMEYELLDTGVFDEDRYFDVLVEYAKASPEDILVRISATNRGPDPAELHLLPTLWFRNTWASEEGAARPSLEEAEGARGRKAVRATHPELGAMELHVEGDVPLLFTDNETNARKLFGGENATPYVKDAFHEYVIHGRTEAVNPARKGTKVAAHHVATVAPGATGTLRLRLSPPRRSAPFERVFDDILRERALEADAFYEALSPAGFDADRKLVFRQALAGMLWSKQYYHFDLERWIDEHGGEGRRASRNGQWPHMLNADVISMPDKWEYPWYAAWDLAFHALPLALVDEHFAKEQLDLMLRERYLHPNGQIPAYEWNFGDVNPPVHAWATNFAFQLDRARNGKGDIQFLGRMFQKLLLNFTWWVNRKDPTGRNVFEGGFLGLDNIGVFDRSSPLPTGGFLEQADGTAWMAFFCQCMLEMALELGREDPAHTGMAYKFFEHFIRIAAAMDRIGERRDEMWDDGDGFFYDLLRLPDGSATRLKVRSMVGLLPLCAVAVIEDSILQRMPELVARARWFLEKRPELVRNIALPQRRGVKDRRLLAILDEGKLRRVLAHMLDEEEFLSPHGIRALSRHHLEHPYVFRVGAQEYRVGYNPAESDTGMFGGNSNWRGPVWMPVNALIVRALLQYYTFYGDAFRIECPTGSGRMMTLYEVAEEISRRLGAIFLRGEDGRRPVFGGAEKFQTDPHWKDHVLFYEYFHGDNGAGLGASHQTGWTGVVATLMHVFATTSAADLLEGGKQAAFEGGRRRRKPTARRT